MNAYRLRLRHLLAAWLFAAAAPVRADPGYYLLVPYDHEGLATLEFRYWTFKPDGKPEITWPEVGAGYGVNSRWTTTLFASWIGSSQFATQLSTLNWQNTVMLTQGEGPVDAAVHLQWVKGQNQIPTTLEYGLLLQTALGLTHLNANVIFEQQRGAGAPPPGLKLQWQLRRRIGPGLHAGLLGFDELGPWNRTLPPSQQSHRAGPMVMAVWPGREKGETSLQAGWLQGKTVGRTGHMFTMRAAVSF
jgi:hypothetical protein